MNKQFSRWTKGR